MAAYSELQQARVPRRGERATYNRHAPRCEVGNATNYFVSAEVLRAAAGSTLALHGMHEEAQFCMRVATCRGAAPEYLTPRPCAANGLGLERHVVHQAPALDDRQCLALRKLFRDTAAGQQPLILL